MGLLLRTATANGLSLHALRELAGVSTARLLNGNDVTRMALILGNQVPDLEATLFASGQYMGRKALQYQGHVFVRTNLLRTRKPQVCPICIHRGGYCRAAWDCVFYTTCHIHHVPLIDRCGDCLSPLTWYRPAIDVCRCHAYLKSADQGTSGQRERAIRLSAWLADQFEEHSDSTVNSAINPSWLGKLSIDGLCSLVQAFGMCSAPHQRVIPNALCKEGSPGRWREISERGLERLENIELESPEPCDMRDVIWEGGLEGIALRCVNEVDRQIALMLVRGIFGKHASARFGSLRAPLSQLALF